VKVLLDEHVPIAVADALRARGHDAVAVAERPDLRGVTDRRVWEAAAVESRTVVTFDIAGFRALAAIEISAGRPHPGVVLCSSRASPPTRTGVGRIADALETLELAKGPGGFGNGVLWLPAVA
jgi:predicted nuclease of predicted toxin-antitoxin system